MMSVDNPIVLDGGRITLWRGDCLEILPTLAAGSVDAVIMDSPYSERTHSSHDASANGHLGGGFDNALRRTLNYAAWTPELVMMAATECARVCSGWTVHFTDHVLCPTWHKALSDAGRYVFAPVVVYAPGSRCRLSGDGPSCWVTWIVVSRTAKQARWGTLPGGYLQTHNEARDIAGAKPLEAMLAIVADYSRTEDLVCDPCLGSGTTGVACIRTGRRFVGIEIDEGYFQIAVKRIERELELRDGRGPLFNAKPGLFLPQPAGARGEREAK